MTGLEIAAAMLGSTAAGSVVTALFTRRSTALTAFADAYDALAKRVTDLETSLTRVEQSLKDEQLNHERTRNLFRLALRHIRDVVTWGASERDKPLPVPPAELTSEMY